MMMSHWGTAGAAAMEGIGGRGGRREVLRHNALIWGIGFSGKCTPAPHQIKLCQHEGERLVYAPLWSVS
jgi:hypothetical protein